MVLKGLGLVTLLCTDGVNLDGTIYFWQARRHHIITDWLSASLLQEAKAERVSLRLKRTSGLS